MLPEEMEWMEWLPKYDVKEKSLVLKYVESGSLGFLLQTEVECGKGELARGKEKDYFV